MNRKELELRDKRGVLLDEVDALLKAVTDEKRNLTDDEQKAIRAKHDEAEALNLEIAQAHAEGLRQAEQLDIEIRGGKPNNTGKSARGPLEVRSWQEVCRRTGRDYDMGPWKNEAEYFGALFSSRHDPRLQEMDTRSLSTLVPEDGGFAVPEPVAAGIMKQALEQSLILSRAQVFPMSSRTEGFVQWKGHDHSDEELFGGFAIAWTAEEGEIALTYPKMQQLKFDAKKLTLGTRVSNEWKADAARGYQDMMSAISETVSWSLDNVLINGTGSNKPQGILNSPAKVAAAAESGQAAATILSENVVKMIARLNPASWNSSIWVSNLNCLPQLASLVWAAGTAGVRSELLRDDGRGNFTLAGRPLYFSEKAKTLGTEGDLMLIDPTRYGVGLRAGLRIDVSEHAEFLNDRTVVRAILRIDGKSLDPLPITPLNGADTLAPFVTLATRAG